MLVQFQSSIAGANFQYQVGDIADWPNDQEAERLAERGTAEIITRDRAEELTKSLGRPIRKHKPETAARSAPEKATTR